MNILIIGYGKMGHEIEKVAIERGHTIIAKKDAADNLGDNCNADVAIEFSTPQTAVENIFRCFDLNIPIVCGTTGWYDRLAEVREKCESGNKSLFYAPNFSIGMNIMLAMNRMLDNYAKQYGYRMQLSETHHIHKIDKPSGTAIRIAEDIIANDKRYSRWSIDQKDDDTLFINVHREGEVFGIHETEALSDCDRITLKHEAFSRRGFAVGAVAAAEYLIGRKGCHTMSDLLGQQNKI